MKNNDDNKKEMNISFSNIDYKELKADCEKCFGFCCVALYFSASEGFPENKDAGKPCINLQQDFRCKVHKNLKEKGLKGCMAYDCFGAGQMVAQNTYGGQDWRMVPKTAKQMYDVFLIMRQIYEMLWYLTESHRVQTDSSIKEKLNSLINDTKNITMVSADELIKVDLVPHRMKVNQLLSLTSESVRVKERNKKKQPLKFKKVFGRGFDLIGKDLRKIDLKGEDLRGAMLIAANLSGVDLTGADFIGSDMRDANLSGANLSQSIFLTQGQINSAKGDSKTKLPPSIMKPTHWER
ncbi:MAG: pentapeptide repeat-containing protein [Clostridiaceae bacterium]